MIIYANPATVSLQIIAQRQDGTSNTSITSGTVRVYHLSALGAEVVDLAPAALVGTAAPIWRYVWAPASLADGHYIAEYTLIAGGTTYAPITEEIDVRAATDVSAALSSYDAATGTDVSAVPAATAALVPDASAIETAAGSALSTADIPGTLATAHGAGSWEGGGSSLTAQDVRDAMKLAPTVGTTIAAGSVDRHLDNIEARANAGGVFGTALLCGDERIHVGCVKKAIYLDCVVDVSTATTLQVRAKPPSGWTKTWTGTLHGTHEVKYETASVDFNAAGEWELQPYYVLADGTTDWGASVSVTVYAPI